MTGLSDAGEELRRYLATRSGRLSTGFSIDNLGRIARGEQGIICARSGAGKTALACNIIARTPEVPTAFVSLEMPKHQVLLWLVSITYGLKFHADLLEDAIADEEDPNHERALLALADIHNALPNLILLDPSETVSLADIRGRIDRAVVDGEGQQPWRVLVDHFGLLRDAKDYGTTIAALNLAKTWAKKDNLAVILLQQSTKSGELVRNDGHLPVTLSSGVWSDGSSADFFWGVYRPSLDPKMPEAERQDRKYESRLNLVKNRATGRLDHSGIKLQYAPYSKRLYEEGDQTDAPIRKVPGDHDE